MTNYEYLRNKERIVIVGSYNDIDNREDSIYIVSHKNYLAVDKDYVAYAGIPGNEPVSVNAIVTENVYYSKTPALIVPVPEFPFKGRYNIVRGGGSAEILSANVELVR